ncbi:hypothetical protein Aoki45_07120 [Algoriphagus sp. oki45]|nr:hypothetical protein Aoki45_07120 [Algoriphagus sp. oki45]
MGIESDFQLDMNLISQINSIQVTLGVSNPTPF